MVGVVQFFISLGGGIVSFALLLLAWRLFRANGMSYKAAQISQDPDSAIPVLLNQNN